MNNLLSLFLNTNFWILINLILLGAIISLVYHRYVTVKRNITTINARNEYEEIQAAVSFFENLLKNNMREKAITYAFNKLMTLQGAAKYPDKTYKEILQNNLLNLSNYKRSKLLDMYEIYEKVRFARMNATDEEVERFKALLYSVITYNGA